MTIHALDVMHHRDIDAQWVQFAIEHPSCISIVSENETHYFATISQADNKCLKVVLNPLTNKVVTLYFDRNMRKKGCK